MFLNRLRPVLLLETVAFETAVNENSSSASCVGFNNVNVASGNVLVGQTGPNVNSGNVLAELIGLAAASLVSVNSGNVNVASGNVLVKSKELVADSNIVNVLSENVQVESSSRPHSQCSKSTSTRISPAQIAACFQKQNALIEQHKEAVLLETELSKQEAMAQLGQFALKERQQLRLEADAMHKQLEKEAAEFKLQLQKESALERQRFEAEAVELKA